MNLNNITNVSITSSGQNPTYGFTFIYSFLGLGITVINGLILVAYIRRARVRDKIGTFIINLVTVDFLNGLVSAPINAWQAADPVAFDRSPGLCVVGLCLPMMLSTSAIASVLLVGLDRLVAIVNPFRYHTIITTRRARLIILLVWLHSFLSSFSPTFIPPIRSNSGHRCNGLFRYDSIWVFYYVIVIILLPIILTVGSYIAIYRIAKRHLAAIKKTTVELDDFDHSNQNLSRKLSKHSKAAKTTFIITVLFCVSWIPCILLIQIASFCGLGECYSPRLREQVNSVFPVVVCLIDVTSIANPLIYALREQVIKDEVKRLLTFGRWKDLNVSNGTSGMDNSAYLA